MMLKTVQEKCEQADRETEHERGEDLPDYVPSSNGDGDKSDDESGDSDDGRVDLGLSMCGQAWTFLRSNAGNSQLLTQLPQYILSLSLPL